MHIFRHILIFMLVWLFAMTGSLIAIAKPIKIQSDNFTFIGDVREKDGQELVLELEQYRSAILQLLGAEPDLEPIRVRIYAAKNDKELVAVTGLHGIGGVYQSTMDGPIFILNAGKGFSRGNRARHIALHEYTHHILAAYTEKFYPRWYNEGFANYLATFEVNKDGGLVIGRPHNPYGYALSDKYWMPTEVLVNSIRKYPFKAGARTGKGVGDQDRFYAQSWLAVHYLQSTKSARAKAKKYTELLNSEKRPDNMFETAFGYSPDEFHNILKAYYKKNKFSVFTLTPTFDLNTNPFEITPLTKQEMEFHRAEAMRFFTAGRIQVDDILKQYGKAEEKLGRSAQILAAKADLLSRQGKYAEAEQLIEQALAMDSEDRKISKLAGLILIHKNREADVANSAEVKTGRNHLEKGIVGGRR